MFSEGTDNNGSSPLYRPSPPPTTANNVTADIPPSFGHTDQNDGDNNGSSASNRPNSNYVSGHEHSHGGHNDEKGID